MVHLSALGTASSLGVAWVLHLAIVPVFLIAIREIAEKLSVIIFMDRNSLNPFRVLTISEGMSVAVKVGRSLGYKEGLEVGIRDGVSEATKDG